MGFDVDILKVFGTSEIHCQIEPIDGVTVLFGPSGVGKTTVLNMIAGLIDPDFGHINVAGETLFNENWDPWIYGSLPAERRRAGYVFQQPLLFPHKNVRANLLYGAPDDSRLAEIANLLDIADLLDRRPTTLSGGEAKRVAIGRALLSNPRFLLMDEPLASLDGARAEAVLQAVERVRDELGLPILYVTHDPNEADRVASQVVRMRR